VKDFDFLVKGKNDDLNELRKELNEIKLDYIDNKREEMLVDRDPKLNEDQKEQKLRELCKEKVMILKDLTGAVKDYNNFVIEFDSNSVKKNQF